jgi:hypothetical protein
MTDTPTETVEETPSVVLVPVRGRFVDENQRPLAGQTILFSPRAKVRQNIETLVTIVGRSVRATLDGYGNFVTALAATDDPATTPIEWTWIVTEEWLGGRTYDIPVPIAQQFVGVDLSQVAPADGSGGIGWEVGPMGPQGPPGPQGQDGDASTAWLTGDGPPPDYISGARPGDLYVDNLTGIYYKLV